MAENDFRTAALAQIRSAFADRRPPSIMTESKQLSDTEYEEVMSYERMDWRDITFEHVARYADALFWFAPQAFSVYLPGILAAGLREGRSDTNAYDTIITALDRSPEPDYWNDFFLPRWTKLTPAEVEAVALWALWLEEMKPDAYLPNTYARVQKTLDLLKDQAMRR